MDIDFLAIIFQILVQGFVTAMWGVVLRKKIEKILKSFSKPLRDRGTIPISLINLLPPSEINSLSTENSEILLHPKQFLNELARFQTIGERLSLINYETKPSIVYPFVYTQPTFLKHLDQHQCRLGHLSFFSLVN